MELDELIIAVRDIVSTGVRLNVIEKRYNFPLNHLSGMLNKKRPFPKKWQKKLNGYVLEYQLTQKLAQIPAPGGILDDLVTHNEAIIKVSTNVTPKRIDPVSPEGQSLKEKAEPGSATARIPPPGLTKAQQLRWHRENTQTLS